jgi:hypothetical protein
MDGHKDRSKRKRHGDDAQGARIEGKTTKIRPGERLEQFNRCVYMLHCVVQHREGGIPEYGLLRRVEDAMRPLVKSAMRSSSAIARRVAQSEFKSKPQPAVNRKTKPQAEAQVVDAKNRVQSPVRNKDKPPKEFQTVSTCAPRRLNDVAKAPPVLTKFLHRAGARAEKHAPPTFTIAGAGGVLSMAQKVMMEEEREKAIVRYRELKEKKRTEAGDN